MKRLPPFDKYALYHASVQDVEATTGFVERTYKRLFDKRAKTFSEDFCGTFAMSCEWVRRHGEHFAYAVDRDPEPVTYGLKHYFPELKKDQQTRLKPILSDVLSKKLPRVDVIAAMNFSFYIFKQRETLLAYFKNCYRRLNKKGMFVVDCFGGTDTTEPNVDETKFKTFTYYWDQTNYDPIQNHSLFYIHFKRDGEKKREKVFTYDWRMWNIPELREIFKEAGFKENYVYWEGTDKKGHGNGVFHRKEKDIHCRAWVGYIVGVKR